MILVPVSPCWPSPYYWNVAHEYCTSGALHFTHRPKSPFGTSQGVGQSLQASVLLPSVCSFGILFVLGLLHPYSPSPCLAKASHMLTNKKWPNRQYTQDTQINQFYTREGKGTMGIFDTLESVQADPKGSWENQPPSRVLMEDGKGNFSPATPPQLWWEMSGLGEVHEWRRMERKYQTIAQQIWQKIYCGPALRSPSEKLQKEANTSIMSKSESPTE